MRIVVWGYAKSWIVTAYDSDGKIVRTSDWLPDRDTAERLADAWGATA